MAENPVALSADDKKRIRTETASLILDPTVTQDDITKRHKEFADELGCTLAQIAGTAAYVRYWANQSLREVGGLDELTADDVVYIWNQFLGESDLVTMASILQEELQTRLACTPEQLLSLFRIYQGKIDFEVTAYRHAVHEVIDPPKVHIATAEEVVTLEEPAELVLAELPLQEVEAPLPPPTPVKAHPKSGAWVDYEHNEIKERWRTIEADFIDQNIDKDPEARTKMRILCTPGIKCYLEVRHLLKLGFKPENVVAIERDKKGWPDFETNAREIGLQPKFGELKEVVPNLKTPFDIVCLDFVNSGSVENQLILESLPLAPKAVVAINVLAKRERTAFQEMIGRLHKTAATTAPQVGREHMHKEVGDLMESVKNEGPLEPDAWSNRIFDMTANALQAIKSHLSTDNDMSWEERETMLWYMQRYAGTLRDSSWLLPNAMKKIAVDPLQFENPEEARKYPIDKLRMSAVGSCIDELRGFFIHLASISGAIIRDDRILHLQNILDLLNAVIHGRRQIVAMEKYKYKSKVGKTSSPFLTSLCVTELPKKDYRLFQRSAEFAMKYAEFRWGHNSGELPPIDYKEEESAMHTGLGFLRLMIVDRAKKEGKQNVYGLNMDVLLNELDTYFKRFMKRYPLSTWEGQHAVPWQNLEDL